MQNLAGLSTRQAVLVHCPLGPSCAAELHSAGVWSVRRQLRVTLYDMCANTFAQPRAAQGFFRVCPSLSAATQLCPPNFTASPGRKNPYDFHIPLMTCKRFFKADLMVDRM